MLLRIGEFARLTGLPVRTVRYYGDIGLLPPASVDPDSGYRYYQLRQLERARQLIALKAAGMSLEEIRLILNDQLSLQQFRTLLESKVVELSAESHRLSEQLQRAQAQLEQIERRMGHPMAEITLKKSERKTIAYIRRQIGSIEEIGPLFPRLFESVDPVHGVGPAGNIYHHFAPDGSSIDIEAVLPVPNGYEPSGEAEVRVIEPADVACLTHHGAFNRLHEAHAQVLSWIEANGYTVSGPSYEWNIVCTPPVTQDDESYVTEIEVEVAKA